jgi:hypothetical protein
VPFPNQPTQFPPGQSGNPGGYSRGRRITNELVAILEREGVTAEIATVILAMATGKKHLLRQKIRDPETGKDVWFQRTPELGWLNTLLDRTEGKVPERPPGTAEEGPARRIEIPDADGRFEGGDEG